MLFSSVPFLYYFFPIVLLLYFAMPFIKGKNAILLIFSLLFYAWGEPKYVILMGVSIILGYVFGILIGKSQKIAFRRLWLVLSCVTSLGFLAYFKYADFFIENFAAVTGISVSLLRIALPIGISFYTFQILSYTIDVYRREAAIQKSLLNFATYVCLFPQLIAGPIVRYTDIDAQLESRKSTVEGIYKGAIRFIVGLSKKVLIANTLGALCADFRALNEKTVVFYWMYAIAFSLQIYFDFSGYSDMAIGLGRILGFDFLENFNYPYISRSITEFWRRWHMSLGSWFRDYVYIPLGGNRVSKARWFFNIGVVWMLTGFWHGAAWNFIIWGLMFAVLLIIEKIWLKGALEKLPAALSHIYVLFLVMISFVVFNGSSLIEVVSDIGGLFGAGTTAFTSSLTVYYLRSYAVVFIIGFIAATPLMKNIYKKLCSIKSTDKVVAVLEPVIACVLLLIVTAYLVDGSFNPFLYFRF